MTDKNIDRLSSLVFQKADSSWGMVTRAGIIGEFLVELVHERGYYWDSKRGEYVSRWNGRPVKESTVRRAVEKYNSDFVGKNIGAYTDAFLEGKIDLPTWQQRVARELKDGHILNYTIGKGGRAQMGPADWGRIGASLRNQYKYLNNFAVQIKNQMVTAGQIRYRVSMYVDSIRTSYFGGLTQAKRLTDNTEERRVTTSDRPCDSCIEVESRGWQPIGTLPLPGTQCQGYTNCKCIMEYR